MTDSERNDDRRVAEALGWTRNKLMSFDWTAPDGGVFTSHPNFRTNPGAAWDAAVKIVAVDFSLNYEAGGVVFTEIDDESHRLSVLGFYAATPGDALVDMIIADLDAKEDK